MLALFADTIKWREAEGFPYFGGTWTRPQQVGAGLLVPLGRDWDEFSADQQAHPVRAAGGPGPASAGEHAAWAPE